VPRVKDDTAKKLLDAAKNLVHAEGHESVTVRKVAELAGCTYPLLYHYYNDLDGLLWALRSNMIGDMIHELDVPSKRGADPIEMLRNAFLRYMDYFFDHPNVYRFFYFHDFKKPLDDEGYAAMERRLMALRADYFSGLNFSGEVVPGQSEIMAKTIIFTIHGMITLALSSNGDLNHETAVCELNALISYLFHIPHEPGQVGYTSNDKKGRTL